MSHPRSHTEEARILARLEREQAAPKAFRALSAPVWKAGALSEKDKHLVAVVIAQITRCAFCIEHHAELARHGGASAAEAVAISYLSAALESLGDAVVSVDAGNLVVQDEDAVAGSGIAEARQRFVQQVFDTDALTPALVWVAAAAAAYAQSNDARRRVFHAQALEAGAPGEALDEAYAIAVVLRAGAVYAHVLHVADAFAHHG
ncbi:carboxymuconolactone decarboxylase family protein [Caballeronia sp. LZ033]|uniref:carboxymuconolactone decarboxylase family protein n=1 Tax=Caballeronia sp. LZ033 TaxID=3038566 RepID=UPI00285A3E0B|nr:carboxymuconolactone decarboxylase family protein [Caballeronia sp. LZ033]MDR5815664.1 carboxymuconolactone decarboxylase family protein [Caballeronia sp. LZ033]